MSNYLAIATITATLQRTLQSAVQVDIEGARVTTVRPNDVGNSTPEMGVNLFLYHVLTNPALHNLDATPLRSRGNPIRRQAALDLYYMFSFYGNETVLEPQRLLGSVVRTLNDKRIFTPDMIRDTCSDSTFSYLRNASLADQIQQISICPMDLNLEDLSKTWSVFFQTPYLLSMAYKVLVVLLDGEESAVRALPVRSRAGGGVVAFPGVPQVEQVVAQGGPYAPILPSSTLVIRGQQLKGSYQTQVRLCGVEVVPTVVSDREIELPLSLLPPAALRAGVQSLQVIHPLPLNRANLGQSRRSSQAQIDPTHQRGAESNAAPFVLRPRLLEPVQVTQVDEADDDRFIAQVQCEVYPAVEPGQRIVLVLNAWTLEAPQSYLFEAEKRSQSTTQLVIPLQGVEAGEYLVRVLVDGAESQLSVDDDPESPTYDWYIGPKIQIG